MSILLQKRSEMKVCHSYTRQHLNNINQNSQDARMNSQTQYHPQNYRQYDQSYTTTTQYSSTNFLKMSISTMKQTTSKRQQIQDQERVNNYRKPIIEGGIARHKTQKTSLKFNNIFKTSQKKTNSTQQQI